MATIIWQPPLLPSAYPITKSRIQPALNANRFKAQGRNYNPANTDGDADEGLPSVAEIMSDHNRQQPRSADSADKNEGTRDKPVILDDNDNRLDDSAFISASASPEYEADATLESSKPAYLASHEAWWDVENGCCVDDDQPPLLSSEPNNLASARSIPQSRHPIRPSHLSPHDKDRNLLDRSEDPTPYLQPTLLGVDDRRKEPVPLDGSRSDNNSSAFEGEMLQAFEEQAKLSSPATPSSLCHCRHSPELLPNEHDGQFQAERNRAGIEEMQYSPQDKAIDEGESEGQVAMGAVVQQEADGVVEERQQEGEEDVFGVAGGVEMQREEQQHEEEGVLEAYLHNREEDWSADDSKDGDYSRDTSGEDEEENSRPAKRRKFPATCGGEGRQGIGQHSSKLDASPLRRSSSVITEPGDMQSPTVSPHLPTSSKQLSTPPPSQSSSIIAESETATEYKEWPLHGFLKRVTIGNKTIFNLEFHLVNIPKHPELSGPFEALSSNLGVELSAPSHRAVVHPKTQYVASRPASKKRASSTPEATVSRRAVAPRKPGKELTDDEESLLVKMVYEDETWAEIERQFPNHTLQLLKENFFLKQGGEPRKRGRKSGARVASLG